MKVLKFTVQTHWLIPLLYSRGLNQCCSVGRGLLCWNPPPGIFHWCTDIWRNHAGRFPAFMLLLAWYIFGHIPSLPFSILPLSCSSILLFSHSPIPSVHWLAWCCVSDGELVWETAVRHCTTENAILTSIYISAMHLPPLGPFLFSPPLSLPPSFPPSLTHTLAGGLSWEYGMQTHQLVASWAQWFPPSGPMMMTPTRPGGGPFLCQHLSWQEWP